MRPFAMIVGALLVGLRLPVAVGADYWAYQYKNIDVTAVGSRERAVDIAHNVDRLGTALARILSFRSTERLPTHIYVLPDEVVKKLTGSASMFNTSGYDATVVAAAPGTRGDQEYWGPCFGYVGSLLVGDGALRYPDWFKLGVPQVFAGTEFERTRLKGVSAGFAYELSHGQMIPMRTFLGLRLRDPQMHDPRFSAMYEAEAWYLAREILVEGRYRAEFGKYLGLMHDGKSEAEAFTASFKIGYEDLDKQLVSDFRAPAHYWAVEAPADTSADLAPPFKLSEAETKARLARANYVTSHRAEALNLANEALQAEAANETALRVLALARLGAGDYPGALAAVDQLAAHAMRSPDALADSGQVLVSLAAAVTGKRAALAVDAPTLLRRAHEDYRAALNANAEDLRSWAGLADVYARQQDAEGARTFLTSAAQALERHPHNVTLAYGLASMCSRTGQIDCALRYSAVWRDNALSDANRDQAAVFASRLRAVQEHRDVTATGAPATPAPPQADSQNSTPPE